MKLTPIVEQGPQVLNDGDNAALSLGKGSAALFGGLHGRRVASGYNGLIFSAIQTSFLGTLPDVTTSGPASVPLAIYNPPTSKRYVSLIRWEMSVLAVPTTPVIGAFVFLTLTGDSLAAPSASLTLLSIVSKQRSNSAIPTFGAISSGVGTFYRPFVNHLTGATTTTPNHQAFAMEFDGTCILSPNTWIWLAQLNQDATNSTVQANAVWEEIVIR